MSDEQRVGRTGTAAPAGDGRGASSGAGGDDPWIESREGGLFFVNALFIFPWIMVAVPLLTRVFVRGMGGMQEYVRIVDTFPELAEYLMPVYGWLALVPIWLVVRNLRIEPRPRPRAVLLLFLLLHGAALLWTVTGWLGLHEWTLPGAAPDAG